MLEVSEIFYSIQGESSFSGLPCIFIRLSGCNLRCSYCDTGYSYKEDGKNYSVDELLGLISGYSCSLVEITGGEPLLQDEVYTLFDRLIEKQYSILLETNGSISIENVPPEVIIIMDIKSPGSGAADSFDYANIDILARRHRKHKRRDEIKFVITSTDDYHWSRDLLRRFRLPDFASVLFSPVTADIQAGLIADLILQDNLPVRLQLQLHTILWPGAEREK